MSGQKVGRSDRPCFIGPFRLLPGVQKLTDMKTYRWTQKQRKKIKKPTLSLVNAGPPDRVSVLSTKCGGCHPKGLIVASSRKKTNNNNNIKIYICQRQFDVLLDKNKNQLKLLIYLLVAPNFWN